MWENDPCMEFMYSVNCVLQNPVLAGLVAKVEAVSDRLGFSFIKQQYLDVVTK